MPPNHQFTSDNRSGICPEAWAALAECNAVASAPSYGDDHWTRLAADRIREVFETDCDVYFVLTGTAANSLALATLCRSYHSVICHESAHIETDECGAPEFFSNGTKLLTVPGSDGKLLPDAVEAVVRRRTDIHFPKPRVLSLTQSTELGTIYTPSELNQLCQRAASLGLRVQMDGARFANAVASGNCAPADLTWRAGVDVLCLGGTKNGMSIGEAVIFFDRKLGEDFAYRCKQAGQLTSKMRFVAAQWAAMLHNGTWLKYATHANAMAQRLAAGVTQVPQCKLRYPVQSNSAFVELPKPTLAALRQRGWDLYTFIGDATRFVCSWDTCPADVDHVVADLKSVTAELAASNTSRDRR